MISVERTFDYEQIRQIVTHPRVYPAVSDDTCPPAEEYRPNEDERIVYLLIRDGNEVLGCFLFVPQNGVTWEVHTCILPSGYGKRAAQAALISREWMWRHTGARRLITNVPAYNRLAMRFARCAGMTEFGRNTKSFLRDGQLWDQIMLGLSKTEKSCQQLYQSSRP